MVLSFYVPKDKGMEGKQEFRWNVALKSFLHRQNKKGKSYKVADVVVCFFFFFVLKLLLFVCLFVFLNSLNVEDKLYNLSYL